MVDSPVSRTTLLDQQLPDGVAPSRVEVRRITIAPSVAGGAHRHNGAVLGNIESGSVVFQLGDGPSTILQAGDVFYEPAHAVVSKFDATNEGVTFIAYFLLESDQAPEIEFLT
jgi:quercetin dioxygenase-like cupin family protein